jgi:hypothetical protein
MDLPAIAQNPGFNYCAARFRGWHQDKDERQLTSINATLTSCLKELSSNHP